MVFQWILSDKSPHVSRTLLSALADLSNAVVWMVLAFPPIFDTSCPLTMPLGTIPTTSIIIGMTVTFMFHNFIIIIITPLRVFTPALDNGFPLESE